MLCIHIARVYIPGASDPGPRVAMNAAQHRIANLLKTFFFFFFFAHQFSLVFVYLTCGPRQLFFQCGPEKPKVWTPLVQSTRGWITCPLYLTADIQYI